MIFIFHGFFFLFLRYSNEGTWRVFSLVGGVAAEEYIVGLGIVMKVFGGILYR